MTPALLALVTLLALPPRPAAGEEGSSTPFTAADTLLPSYPPCFDVTLSADATGAQPLSYTWTLPDGSELHGNPAILDTALLPAGWNEVLLSVSNRAATATYPYPIVVESLAFRAAPSFTVSGLRVDALANTSGATEWRWDWGDGTVSDWASGCAGYAPSHTYAADGSYTVAVEARSCREQGALAQATVQVGSAPPTTIDSFQAVCPTEPFCTFTVGEPVSFDTVVSGSAPDAYAYDWNGDGADDEVSSAPITTHTYLSTGTPIPRLTVLAGTTTVTAYNPAPIEILAASAPLFSDGFESGDLSRWSLP